MSLCASLDQEWYSWKSLHSKTYEDEDEEGVRRVVWYDNYKKILEHNSANRSYSLALNQFADLVGSVLYISESRFLDLYIKRCSFVTIVITVNLTTSTSLYCN